jgi:hypothetical protein
LCYGNRQIIGKSEVRILNVSLHEGGLGHEDIDTRTAARFVSTITGSERVD